MTSHIFVQWLESVIMPREGHLKTQHMRARIAAAAARLMAEDGMDDCGHAKRKAARQLGAESTQALPSNEEVEQALRDYQAIYLADEQRQRIQLLRRHALEVMQALEAFRPYLRGAVLSGTAGRYSPIDLQLFTDDSKAVEMFLLNQQIPYETSERRTASGDAGRPVTQLTLEWDGIPVNLAVHPANDERVARKVGGHQDAVRASMAALRNLIAEPA